MTKGRLAVLSVALVAIAAGVLSLRTHSAAETTAKEPGAEKTATAVQRETEPVAPLAADTRAPGTAREAKPVTDGQKALADSRIPTVGALSIDRQGSPREWLPFIGAPDRAARDAQLSKLETRSSAHLGTLRDRLAAAKDPAERARLAADIATFERNAAERSAIVSRTVRDEARPFAERAR